MSFVNRQKHEAERLTEIEGREAVTFCDVDEGGAGTSALLRRCNTSGRKTTDGVGDIDSDEVPSTVTSQHVSSSTLTPSSAEMTSTGLTSVHCLTIKIEPNVEEQSNSASHQENNKRCHDSVSDDVIASRCVRRDGGGLNSDYTASSPSVSFSHRLDCPCEPLSSIAWSLAGTAQGQPRRGRRRTGLSRLRRTELRRRSRIVTDVTEDLADGVGGTPSMAIKDRLGVDRTAHADVISAETRPVLHGQNGVAVSDVFSKSNDVRMNRSCGGTFSQSITTNMQPTTSVTSSPVGTSTTMKTTGQSSETLRASENKSTERATADDACDRRCMSVKKKCPSISTEHAEHAEDRINVIAAGTCPAVSTSSFDISKMSASSSKATPVTVWRTLNGDIVPLSSVVSAPAGVPFTPLLRRTVTQCAVADTGVGSAGRSPIVNVPRCHIGSAAKLRRRYGHAVEKQHDVVVWMQTGRVALAAPVLRCGLTALKYNRVALVNSPAYYVPRHTPIIYPRYRFLCYRPSPCV